MLSIAGCGGARRNVLTRRRAMHVGMHIQMFNVPAAASQRVAGI
jgi:hypothetical protein